MHTNATKQHWLQILEQLYKYKNKYATKRKRMKNIVMYNNVAFDISFLIEIDMEQFWVENEERRSNEKNNTSCGVLYVGAG